MQQHKEPAWRHKADFIFGVKVKDPEYAKTNDYEQLWGRNVCEADLADMA